ncbi:hypothetical protein SISSUDRAFT_1055682 [Sistotremastrum suecicum HHB10207 ss-3]|uniref:Uncharacterized protein n=1 Tax=Sistotremastrum suecicum HHB10207 ss-3 TaxID=1314776 RepID=A0A165XLS0_9AGAM|nr:hypothetical protein SISSUDRAFT_1055682 [Sistotremastrum suecicum HHB10207 ss-3]
MWNSDIKCRGYIDEFHKRALHDPQSSSHSATTVSKSPIWNAARTLKRPIVESVSDP